MTDVAVVFGTRPEAVKLAPVVRALRERGVRVTCIATGQHATLIDDVLWCQLAGGGVHEIVELRLVSDGTLIRFLSKVPQRLRKILRKLAPKCVVVQGDTMSAFAGASASTQEDIPVAHVEAGVRSGNLKEPWPEECIRTDIARMARWHYAPTSAAVRNLITEGVEPGRVRLTGNTSVDTLKATGITPRAASAPIVLVTLHRRELRERRDALEVLQGLANAIAQSHMQAVWPIHPGMEPLMMQLRTSSNFTIRPPMTYATMVRALAESHGILTDSGGLVEEAATLGVPTAILRNANDRPEAVAAGIAQQFAVTPDGARLAWECVAQGAIPRRPTDVFGDGGAADRIAQHLTAALTER